VKYVTVTYKEAVHSSLIDRKGMVKTSKLPGCTRLLNLFSLDEQILIVDFLGYGYARAPKAEKRKWAKLIERVTKKKCLFFNA